MEIEILKKHGDMVLYRDGILIHDSDECYNYANECGAIDGEGNINE
jgi:hypothetical protein